MNFEQEIMEATVDNVIPSYAPLCEAYFYLQEATENDWNNFTQDIGIRELGILEATGNSESEDKESPKKGILSFVQDAWSRIKGLFDDLLKKIQGAIASAKQKFNDSMIKKISLRLKETKTDKDGKEVEATYGKFYKYDKLAASMNMSSGSLINDAEEDTVYDREYLRGDEVKVTKDWLIQNFEEVSKVALDFKFTKGQIVKPYNEVKSVFNEEIKKAKSAKADKEEISEIKAKVTALNKIASAIVFAFYERQRLALGIITKVAVHTLKKSTAEKDEARLAKETKKAEKGMLKDVAAKTKEAKKGGKEEAVAASYTDPNGTPVLESYSTEVEKLFDWNF